MSNQSLRIEHSTIFDDPIPLPYGIDDAYRLRTTVPMLILNSGFAFVKSYQEFLYRMIENENSFKAYQGNTARFLNFLFYRLNLIKS